MARGGVQLTYGYHERASVQDPDYDMTTGQLVTARQPKENHSTYSSRMRWCVGFPTQPF